MSHFGGYAMDTEIKTSKEKWKELCIKYDKWCSYEEVKYLTVEQAEKYIRSMSVWVPM